MMKILFCSRTKRLAVKSFSHPRVVRGRLLALLGVAVCLLTVTGQLSAQTTSTSVLNDNFDTYTTGSLVGQGGWVQTSTTTTTPIQVTNPGNAGFVSLATSGQDAYEAFVTSVPHNDGISLSTSFSLNLSAAQTAGDYFAHLTPNAGNVNNFFERVSAKSATGGYLLGLSGDGSTAVYGTTVIAYGALTMVNVVWNFVPGTTNDTFTLNVNGVAYSTFTWASSTAEPTMLATFNLRQGTASSAPTVSSFDNLSVVSTVPEPTTIFGGLLLLVGAGWSQRYRFFRLLGPVA